MAEERIFVGRKKELEQFGKVLEEQKGQAVLVVGQAGMGKTWLVNKMAELAENHPDLKCGWVRYEVTPTDSVDSAPSKDDPQINLGLNRQIGARNRIILAGFTCLFVRYYFI